MDDFSANSQCRKGMSIVEMAKETDLIRTMVQSNAGIYQGSGVQTGVYSDDDAVNGSIYTNAQVTLFPGGSISMSVSGGWTEFDFSQRHDRCPKN